MQKDNFTTQLTIHLLIQPSMLSAGEDGISIIDLKEIGGELRLITPANISIKPGPYLLNCLLINSQWIVNYANSMSSTNGNSTHAKPVETRAPSPEANTTKVVAAPAVKAAVKSSPTPQTPSAPLVAKKTVKTKAPTLIAPPRIPAAKKSATTLIKYPATPAVTATTAPSTAAPKASGFAPPPIAPKSSNGFTPPPGQSAASGFARPSGSNSLLPEDNVPSRKPYIPPQTKTNPMSIEDDEDDVILF